jgi:hypothetical protein
MCQYKPLPIGVRINRTSIGQCRHTTLVISMGIHVVHTDRVGAQLGHPGDIPLALGSVDKRVTWGELISNAYPSQSGTYSVGFLGTLDVELSSILVEELGADSRNGWACPHCGGL